MAKFKLNLLNELEVPKFVLVTRYYERIGDINTIDPKSIDTKFNMGSAQEISFDVYKKIDDIICDVWDDIVDFKYIYVPDYNECYAITVSISETNTTIKKVTGTSVCEFELSNRFVYDFEANSEKDLEVGDEFIPTVFYNPNDKKHSLLDRVLADKCPDYKIVHVDSTLANLQRIITISSSDIYSAFTKTIAEEFKCLFVFNSTERSISVYDIDDERSNTFYGNNTNIYISAKNYANSITVNGESDNLFNCLRLSAGDEVMTAAIISTNPNGSQYLYNWTENDLKDMPEELVEKLVSYNELYEYYQNDYEYNLSDSDINAYNTLIDIIKGYEYEIEYDYLYNPLIGFQSLTKYSFQTIDFRGFLQSSMMPKATIEQTTAEEQTGILASELQSSNTTISLVNDTNLDNVSDATLGLAVKGYAEVIVNPTYKVEVNGNKGTVSSDKTQVTWIGTITVKSTGDEEDVATTPTVTVRIINNNYEQYLKQKIDKRMSRDEGTFYELYKIEDDNEFKNALKLYSLDNLKMFDSCYTSCLEVLQQNGITSDNKELYGVNIWDEMYVPFLNRKTYISDELIIRENQIKLVDKINSDIKLEMNNIQKALSMRSYLGENLYLTLSHYLRESTYENGNYKSDGLSTAEIIDNANKFMVQAIKEIKKASTLQYTLTASLNDLLADEKFKNFRDQIDLGNWITLEVNDELYRLRLISIGLNYSSTDNISVTFSNVIKIEDYISDMNSLLEKARSMASTYDYIASQAEMGDDANREMANFREFGLNTALYNIINADSQDIVIDEHGILCRSYEDVLDDFAPEQLKIINNTLCFTTNNWESVNCALGKIGYVLNEKGVDKYHMDYGLNADFVVAGTIIGGNIYSGNYKEDAKGNIIRGTVLKLMDGSFGFGSGKIVYDATTNELKMRDIILDFKTTTDGSKSLSDTLGEITTSITVVDGKITSEISRIDGITESLTSRVSQTEYDISFEVKRASEAESKISIKADNISSTVSDLSTSVSNLEQTANSISLTVSNLAESTNSRFEATASQIALKVNTSDYTASIIVDKINNGTVSINANNINLNGAVTANQNVTISKDGKITAVNANISGNITATSGSFTGAVYASSGDFGCLHIAADTSLFNKGYLFVGDSGTNIVLKPKPSAGTSWSNYDALFIQNNGNAVMSIKYDGTVNASRLQENGRDAIVSYSDSDWNTVSDIVSANNDTHTIGFVVKRNNITLNTAYVSVDTWSDSRLKNNIQISNVSGLDVINQIQHKSFDFIDDKWGQHKDIGYIAHELEKIIPEAVNNVPQDKESVGFDSLKSINNAALVPYLTKAVQELSAELNMLKEKSKDGEVSK